MKRNRHHKKPTVCELDNGMSLSFEWLLDPIPAEKFFAEFYEQRLLLIERAEPSKWAALLSLEAIDQFLSTTTPRHPDVFLVDAARELSPDDYSLPDTQPPGKIDLPRAYELFATGATISLTQMHERMAPLADLCRAMEKTFSSHFQTNIYLSPPNAQGFKTHYDSHDVFVLQVAGSKHWTIYDTAVELPLRGQAFDPDKDTAGPPTREITLNAGDLLYCPRGIYHSAHSTDETSLHITLGQIAKTWADVILEAVSAACLATPALRANLPAGFANPGYDPQEALAAFRAMFETVARETELAPILERMADDFVTSRRPDHSGGLHGSETKLSLASRIAPRPNLIYRVREANDAIVILFGASEITLPAYVRDTLNSALEHGPLTIGELPGLDDDSKLVLVRRLLKEGLLVVHEGL